MGVESPSRFKVQRPWFLCFFSLLLPSPHLCFPPCPLLPPTLSICSASTVWVTGCIRLEGVIISQDTGPALPGFPWLRRAVCRQPWLFVGTWGDCRASHSLAPGLVAMVVTPVTMGELVLEADSGSARQAGGAGLRGGQQVHRWNNGAGICLASGETSEHDSTVQTLS